MEAPTAVLPSQSDGLAAAGSEMEESLNTSMEPDVDITEGTEHIDLGQGAIPISLTSGTIDLFQLEFTRIEEVVAVGPGVAETVATSTAAIGTAAGNDQDDGTTSSAAQESNASTAESLQQAVEIAYAIIPRSDILADIIGRGLVSDFYVIKDEVGVRMLWGRVVHETNIHRIIFRNRRSKKWYSSIIQHCQKRH